MEFSQRTKSLFLRLLNSKIDSMIIQDREDSMDLALLKGLLAGIDSNSELQQPEIEMLSLLVDNRISELISLGLNHGAEITSLLSSKSEIDLISYDNKKENKSQST